MTVGELAERISLNGLAWRLAALLGSTLGLVAVHLPAVDSRPSAPVSQAALTPVGPPLLDVGGDLEHCVKFCSEYVTHERCFVVFEGGTCVIIDVAAKDPASEAVEILRKCSDPEARFITTEIEDGNYLVTYREAAFHVMLSNDIQEERQRIESDFLTFMTRTERDSMAEDFEPPFHAKLGLIARARLNDDARDRRVVKIIRPKSGPTATPRPKEVASQARRHSS